MFLSRENFDDSITTGTDNPSAVLAPDNGTDALTAHDAVAGNFLCTASSFE